MELKFLCNHSFYTMDVPLHVHKGQEQRKVHYLSQATVGNIYHITTERKSLSHMTEHLVSRCTLNSRCPLPHLKHLIYIYYINQFSKTNPNPNPDPS